jgi:hypothetical protein
MLRVSNRTGFNASSGSREPPARRVAIAWGQNQAATAPHLGVYNWSNVSGFGTVFANPSVFGTNYNFDITWNNAGNVIVWGQSSPANVFAYTWSASGFGTRFANPASRPSGTFQSVGNFVFSPTDEYLACISNEGGGLYVWPWNNTTGFGVRYSNPSNVPGTGGDVDFHPSGQAIIKVGNSSPYIRVWPWSSSGFGTAYANPSVGLSGVVSDYVFFHPTGNDIICTSNTSPFLHAYSFSLATGFGVKYANPSVAVTQRPNMAMSPDGKFIAIGNGVSPYLHVYNFITGVGFGAKLAAPSTAMNGSLAGRARWAPDMKVIACGVNVSPFVNAWAWTPSGFGAKYANPATLPPRQVNRVAWNNKV